MSDPPTTRRWRGQHRASPVDIRRLLGAMVLLLVALPATGLRAEDQDAAAGKRIVENGAHQGSAPCTACHGIDGAGDPASGIPSLAGLDMLYIERELLAFRSAIRSSPVMSQYASELTPDEVRAAAAYLSSLSPKPHDPSPSCDAALKTGRDLALSGRRTGGLPSCASCHGQNGEGFNGVPALAGQSNPYLRLQLRAWREGNRLEGPDFFMTLLARKLSDSDIDAVAEYYAALSANPAPACDGR